MANENRVKRLAQPSTIVNCLSLLVMIIVFVPFTPSMPGESLDPYRLFGANPRIALDASWMFAFNQAIDQGLRFGRDIILTFGPYSSVYSRTYHPATATMMMAASLYLAVSYWFALRVASKRSKLLLVGLVVFVVVGLTFYPETLFTTYVLLVGYACLNIVHTQTQAQTVDSQTACRATELRTDSVKVSQWRTLATVVALFAPFGLLPLIKVSTVTLCVGVSLLVSVLFVFHRKWSYAAIVIVVPIVSLLIFWVMAGQGVETLSDYFFAASQITSGYTEAMAIDGDGWEIIAFVIVSLTIIVTALTDRTLTTDTRVFVFALLVIPLALLMKSGFVRHDGHAIIAGTTLPLIALIASLNQISRRSVPAIVLAFAASTYISSHYIKQPMTMMASATATRLSDAVTGLGHRATIGNWPRGEFNRALTVLNKESPLTTLEGTTDIYSFQQGRLLAANNTWNPRPIFQSYKPYTPFLANKNRDFLLSDKGSKHLFVQVEPIDGRLPSLEDGPSWPVFLDHYRPISHQNGFLLLERRAPAKAAINSASSPKLYTFGQDVSVPTSAGGPVFAKASIHMTGLGKLTDTAYKTSRLQITVTLIDGSSKTFRLVSGMANSGFVISPLIESTAELGLLYADSKYLSNKQVKSFSISVVGSPRYWNNTYTMSFSQLPKPDPVDIRALIDLNDTTYAYDYKPVVVAPSCEGSIDTVNAKPQADYVAKKTVLSSGLLKVDGWLAKSTANGTNHSKVFLVLRAPGGKQTVIETTMAERPDVASAFGQTKLRNSGFTSTVDIARISGSYTVAIGFEEGGQLNVCPQFNMTIEIDGGKY